MRGKVSAEHRKALSLALRGNKNGLGKNLGNKNAISVVGPRNGNWKGGVSSKDYKSINKELIAGRPRANRCELCYRVGSTDFDHCHNTGEFRGWICRRCNLVLGLVNDDTLLLKNLSKYLEIRSDLTRPRFILNSLLTNALQLNDSNQANSETK